MILIFGLFFGSRVFLLIFFMCMYHVRPVHKHNIKCNVIFFATVEIVKTRPLKYLNKELHEVSYAWAKKRVSAHAVMYWPQPLIGFFYSTMTKWTKINTWISFIHFPMLFNCIWNLKLTFVSYPLVWHTSCKSLLLPHSTDHIYGNLWELILLHKGSYIVIISENRK